MLSRRLGKQGLKIEDIYIKTRTTETNPIAGN